MEIKIITCHDVYNYGASLQAYALQTYLKQKGHGVEIVDYLPAYMDKAYSFNFNRYMSIPKMSPLYKYRDNLFFRIVYAIRKYLPQLCKIVRQRGRKLAFDRFKCAYLHLTDHYVEYRDLQDERWVADVFIVGSDQVWNPLFNNGRDPSYFLQFGSLETKRVAYAASFGVSTLEEQDVKRMKEWLKSFSAISVRETTGLNLLSSIGILGAQHVVDPVFLLSQKDWNILIQDSTSPVLSYVLVYNLGQVDESIKSCAQELARKYNLSIISIEDSNRIKFADKNVVNAGPIEFLRYIKAARYVVTNSFHATAFSLKFNVPFYVFIRNATSSRISDVLSLVALQERLNAVSFDMEIDWEKVNLKMENYIKNSKKFIDDILCL